MTRRFYLPDPPTAKNRKVSHPWRWGKAAVGGLVLATMGVLFTGMFLAWANFQYVTHSYQISQAEENKRKALDLNGKLRIELAVLKAAPRLEKLAAQYGMEAPQPSQVVTLP